MRRGNPVMSQRPGHILSNFIVSAIPNVILFREQKVDELGQCEVRILDVSLRILQIVSNKTRNFGCVITGNVILFVNKKTLKLVQSKSFGIAGITEQSTSIGKVLENVSINSLTFD